MLTAGTIRKIAERVGLTITDKTLACSFVHGIKIYEYNSGKPCEEYDKIYCAACDAEGMPLKSGLLRFWNGDRQLIVPVEFLLYYPVNEIKDLIKAELTPVKSSSFFVDPSGKFIAR
jgi:hypothetical protein